VSEPALTAEELWDFIMKHKPEGDWSTAKLLRGESFKVPKELDATTWAVTLDFMYAYIWAAQMVGIESGHETHEPFLEAIGRAALSQQALTARDRQLAELREAAKEMRRNQTLKNGETGMSAVCITDAAESMPECICIACRVMRYHIAQQRLLAALLPEPKKE